ncbi:hypothetical protein I204_00591 [Kwoniella mangroviensis CBS 8886]|uniref:uncharacterized protein n=1 Tax=Kwoniella mangroviensis CBS 8507 TaxID=1296122 RepID=UPI00080CE0BB|nr:uncharacterized protein I203_07161 [Kwoniella mangroviensis CBS 8507]OCF63840.1 hypothetical protein I203_07161 [Kwoniella mangroviensis CBS 8507]OCF78649.1 hypothetical protein I204_00591 [Kwoniella mangroviensis CBS 8886]
MSFQPNPNPPTRFTLQFQRPNTSGTDGPDGSTGPPPRYTAVVQKVYPYSLRPVIFFTAGLGFIYGLALGVDSIRDMGNDNETAKMKVFDIVQAILYFVIAGIEAFCIFIAIVQKVNLARLFAILAPAGILVNVANQILSVVIHFSMKNDLIAQCVKNETGQSAFDSLGDTTTINTDQAETICDNAWDRGTWSVFAWLFLTLVISLLFASILLSYYRQLLDPSSIRSRRVVQQQSFQMQSGYYYPPPPGAPGAPGGTQAWMVPPYPGPPMNGAPPPPPGGYEKGDYHPEAPWAQPPAGEGPSVNREEEDAWNRAQSQGVTAHLTGHAPQPTRRSDEDERGGYRIGNAEEDEAWERARNEGVTAHLTGNNQRNREGTV